MPKVIAKPLSLTVRPFQVSHLCFEVGGILGRSLAELGTKVSAFDFDHLYFSFRDANRGGAVDPGRLRYDSDGIDGLTISSSMVGVRPPALAALRAEPVKAALNKAVIMRENAFITKYGNVAGIAAFVRAIKPANNLQLANLSNGSEAMRRGLLNAYNAAGRTGVVQMTTSDLTSKSIQGNSNSETQHVENMGYDFRFPLVENNMRNDRLQASLGDERVSNFMQTHYLDRMEEVFKNEVAAMDADINQLQVAYLNTILMSPIDGIVTGVYKNLGDAVSPGEPVFRVENNEDVLIVAKVGCRGPISVGSMLQVKTTLFDIPSSPVGIEAEIVAVRGEGEDDQWEVIAKRKNTDNAGKGPLFPLGYNFDYDNTEVNIFAAGEI